MVAQATRSVSSKRASRLSENVRRTLFQIRELSPRWRGLAWARDSRLGEAPQPERRVERECVQLGVFLSFDGWTVLYCTILWWHGGNKYACWEEIICGGLWAWHDFYMSCTWKVEHIYMCVWSRIWHGQQWTLMVGEPVTWYWYERKQFTHDW